MNVFHHHHCNLLFFCFFFSFSLTLGFSSISRKPLEIKLPNLNMFVNVKNGCPKKKFCPPPSKGPPRGQNGLKTHAPNDRENCQSVCYKILLEGTQGIGIEPFSKKFENFPYMREQVGPQK